jgi:murein DD-endopeptidase MepM/ murein hydrolase activator NlpD
VATATLDRLGIGSGAFTGISDGAYGSGAPCIASAGGGGSFNPGDGKSKGKFINPAPGPITSPFGPRVHPRHGGIRDHQGIDIGLNEGTTVKAADGGVVIYNYSGCVAWDDGCGGPNTDGLGPRGGFGNRIEIRHADGSVTAYNHLKTALPPVGSKVSQGQAIGTVGSTGYSTGPHLDFQIYPDGQTPANPEDYINF